MNTDALIAALARDAGSVGPPLRRRMGGPLAAGLAAGTALFALWLGPRPDFGYVIGTFWFDLRLAVVALLALTTLPMLVASLQPGRKLPWGWLVLPLGVLGFGVGLDLAHTIPAAWGQRVMGSSATACLSTIPLLAAAPLVGAIVAMRAGAPTRPMLSGLLAGLFAGAFGAFLYALFCTDVAPLFLAVWYGGAIAVMGGLGALAGRLAVKW